MILRLTAVLIFLLAAVQCFSADAAEMYRIRIENSTGGRVQVSLDEGNTYVTLGHVRRHAVAYYTGFPASAYVPNGTVAATAVHGLRLKVGTLTTGSKHIPITISVVPVEFDCIPEGYGGHIPYGSGIYTDLRAGTGIFRNFAPLVSNPIYLERGSELVSLPDVWKPTAGAVLVVIARFPQPTIRELTFENSRGGTVTATYDDGKAEQIATVSSPLKGIGRFDGTSYTGIGLINTNHGGVLTVSTAPITDSKLIEGQGRERRGGFEIQPSVHATTQYPMPQAMVIAPLNGAHTLEGYQPVFSGYIGLAYDPAMPELSCRAEVSVSGGPWQPMPEIIGKQDSAISSRNITKIRIVFPRYSKSLVKTWLAQEVKHMAQGKTVVKGTANLYPKKSPINGSVVTFAIDGQFKSATTQSPFAYSWDTTTVPNGEHQIDIAISDSNGNVSSTEQRIVVVQNS